MSPHCFFLFWGSVRSPLIFNVLHQHRPHMVPDSHANKSPASTAKHMNPDLHANRSPASAAKHTYHLHCTQLNYKTHRHHRTVCKCRLCSSVLWCLCEQLPPLISFCSICSTALEALMYRWIFSRFFSDCNTKFALLEFQKMQFFYLCVSQELYIKIHLLCACKMCTKPGFQART